MKKKDRSMYKNLGLITQVGLNIVIPILTGVYIGMFIDKKLGTTMIFSMVFIILGTITGFLNLLKLVDKKK